MADKQFNARIRWKRDTSANWTINNPVLLDGEIIIVDTDSGETRFKIGDGVKTYAQLPFEDEVIRNLINNTFDAALPKSGGTMTGALVSQNNTDYTTKQVRNIFLIADGDDLPTGSNGDICLVYTP